MVLQDCRRKKRDIHPNFQKVFYIPNCPSVLSQLVQSLHGIARINAIKVDRDHIVSPPSDDIDFSDVCGQENVKRALEIAAAGGHNLLMIGPPGAGKTMLAQRLSTVLPGLTFRESLETAREFRNPFFLAA